MNEQSHARPDPPAGGRASSAGRSEGSDPELRRRAEERAGDLHLQEPDGLSPADARRLVHELRIHQIELEMQNEELRQAHEALEDARDRYFDLYDLAPVGYLTVSEPGTILEANLTAATLLGLSRGSLVGQQLSRSILPDDQDVYYRHRLQVLATALPQVCELRMRRPDGTSLWTRVVTTLARDDNAAVRICRVTLSDITECKRAEEDRRRLETQLLHAQRLESLSILAGGIAHDFNNILAAILGFAELAMEHLPFENPAAADLREIRHAAVRASALARQMLAYSGKARSVVAPLCLSQVVEDMKRTLETAVSKQTTLVFALAPDLPAMTGDGSQMGEVVLNLVLNASEALGDDEGHVRISTGTVQVDSSDLFVAEDGWRLREGPHILLEVSDTGRGMDDAIVRRVFDPFFSTKFVGRGLGLATVHGIVRGHQGTVRVLSAPGEGTTFQVLLPAKGQLPAAQAEPATTTTWHGSGTVMVVDDEEPVRRMATRMLESAGFSVLPAPDGAEAIRLCRECQTGLTCVLLDLTMPGPRSDDVFRELRQIQPGLRVILTSGYDEQSVAEQFTGSGLCGFIQKPYTRDELIGKLRAVVGDGGATTDSPPD